MGSRSTSSAASGVYIAARSIILGTLLTGIGLPSTGGAIDRGEFVGLPECEGTTPGEWGAHFIDGSKACDARQGELTDRGGDEGADGVDVCDIDGDGDLDIVTGWEESGDVVLYLNPLRARPGGPAMPGLVVQQWQAVDARGRGTNQGVNGRRSASGIEDAIFADLFNPNATTGQGLCSPGAIPDSIVTAQEGDSRKIVLRTPPLSDILDGSEWAGREFPGSEKFFLQAAVGDIDGANCNDVVVGSKNADDFLNTIDAGVWWFECPADPADRIDMNTELRLDDGDLKASKWNRHQIVDGRWYMNLVLDDVDRDGDNDIVFSDRKRIGWLRNPTVHVIQTVEGPVQIFGDPTKQGEWERVIIEDWVDVKDWCEDNLACERSDVPGDEEVYRDMAYADLDGDGLEDILVATNYVIESEGVVGRWFRRLPGSGASWQVYEISVAELPFGQENGNGTIVSKSVTVGDIDRDGDNDLVLTVRGGRHGVYALEFPEDATNVCGGPCINATGLERRTWQATKISPAYPKLKYDNVVLADLDEDCDLDAVTADEFVVSAGVGLGVPWYENPEISTRPIARCRDVALQTAAGSCTAPLTLDMVDFASGFDPAVGAEREIRDATGGPWRNELELGVTSGLDVELRIRHDCTVERTGSSPEDACISTVTVSDPETPTVTCPTAPAAAECTGPTGASVSYPDGSVADNCSDSQWDGCDIASGSVFSIGSTGVSCSGSDVSGNTAGCGFDVRVVDTTAPTISAPEPVTAACTGPQTSVSLSVPTASDLCDVAPSVTAADRPAAFSVGQTLIAWTGSDSSGNSVQVEQSVTIVDAFAPSIDAPSDISGFECNGTQGSAVSLGQPQVADQCDENPSIRNNAPTRFPLGSTTVEWVAEDGSGNAESASQIVSVVDTVAPDLEIRPVAPIECTSPTGTSFAVASPNASDACDATPSVTGSLPDVFPLGETEVSWVAMDASGNGSLPVSQVIFVVDTTAPEIQAPADIIAECTGPAGTVVEALGSSAVSDACDVDPDLGNDAPADRTYPLGVTQVAWFASDDSGNRGVDMQQVSILDRIAPQISCPADLALEPTSTAGTTAEFAATAVDQCSDTVGIECQPVSGNVFAIGTTTAVSCSAIDPTGNSAACSFDVKVLSLSELVDSLIARTGGLGLNRGLGNAMTSRLQALQTTLARSSGNSVCGQIGGLLLQLRMLLDNGQLSAEPEASFVTSLERLNASAGCPAA